MPTTWQYNPTRNQYRDTTTGKYIAQSKVRSLMQQFEDALKSTTVDIHDRLSAGELSLQGWVREMRSVIKDAYISQYIMGRGGINNMSQSDWGRIGGLLKNQYRYLNSFADDLSTGSHSPAQIKARANLYIESSTQAFERGKAASHGNLSLPAYPGDGSTECLTNCKCYWYIRKAAGGGYIASWRLTRAEHCEDCKARAVQWRELTFNGE